MQRWTGTWLGGLAAAGVVRADSDYRGARLGLPAAGPGAVASYGRRLGAFILDLAAGALIGGLAKVLVHHPDPVARAVAVNGAFVLEVAVLVALTGQSIGMRLACIRVSRLAGGPPTLLASVLRAVLILLVVPALLADRDGRGLHDKAVGTVVVRA